ncbi:TPA: hypothetical protein N0F65_009408 [Lagenidium giganteum]|uniref:Amino acid transporter transmembrane domain-containing protein n=1 Tax=Lagenidium giganteum TaxID=4803 RepID=A0AAV2Z9F7_9STRA|nr:TPA: hypothetical protein N0F65_009408 [Lagenidium giganteum]
MREFGSGMERARHGLCVSREAPPNSRPTTETTTKPKMEMTEHTTPQQDRERAPTSSSMVETGIYRYERNRSSHEYFSPGPHSKLRTGTAASAVFNLVSTIIGGGVLSLPYAFDKCGIVLATVFMIIAASGSTFTLYVIVSCSRRGGATTFEEIVRKALGPRAGLVTVVLLVMLTFLTMVAYVILIKDLVGALAAQFLFGRAVTDGEKGMLTIVAVALVLPILFARSMHALRFTSIFSLVSVMVLAVAISIRAINDPIDAPEVDVTTPIKWFPSNWRDPIYAFPIISVSYLCHFNVLPVYRELQKPTRHRLKRIVTCTMISTWFFYMMVGCMGYVFAFRRPGGVKDDILNNFATNDQFVNLGRMGLLVTILLSIPLIIQPCRMNILRLAKYINGFVSAARNGEDVALLDTPRTPALRRGGAQVPLSERLSTHVLLTLAIIASVVTLALDLPGVAVVWNIMGSTVGILISYVLPCISYVLIRNNKPHTNKRKATAWFIFSVSAVMCVACTLQAFSSFV